MVLKTVISGIVFTVFAAKCCVASDLNELVSKYVSAADVLFADPTYVLQIEGFTRKVEPDRIDPRQETVTYTSHGQRFTFIDSSLHELSVLDKTEFNFFWDDPKLSEAEAMVLLDQLQVLLGSHFEFDKFTSEAYSTYFPTKVFSGCAGAQEVVVSARIISVLGKEFSWSLSMVTTLRNRGNC